MSDDPFGAIAHISRGSGYSQYSGYPLPLKTSFSLSKAVYEARRDAGWPDKVPGTIVPGRKPIGSRNVQRTKRSESMRQRTSQMMNGRFASKLSFERFRLSARGAKDER